MAAPAQIRSNMPDFVGSAMLPVMQETFVSEYALHQSAADVLFKKVTTDTSIYQSSEVADMPLFSAISEGADYSMSATKQGYDKTVTVSKYGLAANFSEELVEDAKFGFVADTLRKMAKSARESKEVARMNLLNNAFTTTVTADGLALCHSAHTTPTGSVTIRNQLAVAADLSVSSLKTAVKDFRTVFKGDSGIVYNIKPKYLVVPEDLRLEAIEIVQSQLLAGTSDNNKNSLAGEGLIIVASAHLTDSDAWFLVSDDNGLRQVIRKEIETKAAGSDVGFLNDSIYFKARYREALAALHPMGFFGTPGAA